MKGELEDQDGRVPATACKLDPGGSHSSPGTQPALHDDLGGWRGGEREQGPTVRGGVCVAQSCLTLLRDRD